MTEKNQSQRDVIDTLRTDVAVIKSQMGEVKELQKAISSKMDSFSFVKQSDFDKFKDEIARTYVTRERFAPVQKVFYLVLGGMITGIIGFALFLLQKAVA